MDVASVMGTHSPSKMFFEYLRLSPMKVSIFITFCTLESCLCTILTGKIVVKLIVVAYMACYL